MPGQTDWMHLDTAAEALHSLSSCTQFCLEVAPSPSGPTLPAWASMGYTLRGRRALWAARSSCSRRSSPIRSRVFWIAPAAMQAISHFCSSEGRPGGKEEPTPRRWLRSATTNAFSGHRLRTSEEQGAGPVNLSCQGHRVYWPQHWACCHVPKPLSFSTFVHVGRPRSIAFSVSAYTTLLASKYLSSFSSSAAAPLFPARLTMMSAGGLPAELSV